MRRSALNWSASAFIQLARRSFIAAEQADTLDAAHGFQEMRLLLGRMDDLFGRRLAHGIEQGPAQQDVQQHRDAGHARQQRAVEQHHTQRRHHQHPVDRAFDRLGGQAALDGWMN